MNLIKNTTELFRRPHPFIFNHYSILVPGVATLLIIIVLAPQQLQDLSIARRSWFALLISLVVVLSIYLTVQFLRRLFPRFMQEEEWTVGKEGLLYLLIMVIINLMVFLMLSIFYTYGGSLFERFWTSTLYTLGISIFPIIVLVLFEQYQHQKKQLKAAQQLTESLKVENYKLQTDVFEPSAPFKVLQLSAENGNIELQLAPDELLGLKSDGNYVEVFYLHNGACTVKLIRNKLKHLEPLLPQPPFFRCHNRYIVNGQHILKVAGNARNLELLLRGLDFSIPVSRAKAKAFSDFLHTLR